MVSNSVYFSFLHFIVIICSYNIYYFKLSNCTTSEHFYDVGEQINISVNILRSKTVSPFIFSPLILPFCEIKTLILFKQDLLFKPHDISFKLPLLRYNTLNITFGEDILHPSRIYDSSSEVLCSNVLSNDNIQLLKFLILKSYGYQYIIDEKPVFAELGYLNVTNDELRFITPYIYTHTLFQFEKYQGKIHNVTIIPSIPYPLTYNINELTYSVLWKDTIESGIQDTLINDDTFYINDMMHHTILFLKYKGIITMILICILGVIFYRILPSEPSKHSVSLDFELFDHLNNNGWRQMYGDVFRRPVRLSLFSTFYFSGLHLGLFLLLFLMKLYWLPSYNDQYNLPWLITIDSLSILFAGYKSGYLFKLYEGKGWKKNLFLQTIFLPIILLLFLTPYILAQLHHFFLSLYIQQLADLIFLLLCKPFHWIGIWLGRAKACKSVFPCKVNRFRRHIPQKPFFAMPLFFLCTGFLPFLFILHEIKFLCAIIINLDLLPAYTLLFPSFLLFCLISACAGVVGCFFILNYEDDRWIWLTFFGTASSGILIFCYGIFCALNYSIILKVINTSYFFCVIGFISICLSLISGSVSYLSSSYFVLFLYKNILKFD